MSCRLRDGLSYCQVDGCLVFLDLHEDRYFRLSHALEGAFLAWLRSDDAGGVDLAPLMENRILVPSPDASPIRRAGPVPPACRSALEHRSPGPGAGIATVLEVSGLVCWTQLQLRTRRLDRLLAAMQAQRDRTASAIPLAAASTIVPLLESAARFRHARPYAPIEHCCLLDSIALVRFLARRGLSTRLVFGVTLHPFGAHCWVQAGDWILNDTVGNVVTHTPILEV